MLGFDAVMLDEVAAFDATQAKIQAHPAREIS
jgi:hypothetical protein